MCADEYVIVMYIYVPGMNETCHRKSFVYFRLVSFTILTLNSALGFFPYTLLSSSYSQCSPVKAKCLCASPWNEKFSPRSSTPLSTFASIKNIKVPVIFSTVDNPQQNPPPENKLLTVQHFTNDMRNFLLLVELRKLMIIRWIYKYNTVGM